MSYWLYFFAACAEGKEKSAKVVLLFGAALFVRSTLECIYE